MSLSEVSKFELIGSGLEVIDSKNKSLIGIKGKVIDETRNTITIEVGKSVKKLIKSEVKLLITFGKRKIKINGIVLVGRPEDRLKKK